MNKEEIVAFKKDNKVYTLCKKCKAETFKSEDKESIQGIDWAFDNGFEAQYKGDIYASKDIHSGVIIYYGEGLEKIKHTQKEISDKSKKAMYPLKSEDMFLKEQNKVFENNADQIMKELSKVKNTNNTAIITTKDLAEINNIKQIKRNNLKNSLDDLIKQLKDLTTEKEALIKQLDFALELNQKLKNRNLIQRIFNT